VPRAERVVKRAKSYARRTPRHRLAPLGNPERKHSLLFVLRGGGFFLKRKGCFLSGFCLPSIQAVWRGFNADKAKQKLFLQEEKDFALPWLSLFGDFVSAAQEGAGGMRGGI